MKRYVRRKWSLVKMQRSLTLSHLARALLQGIELSLDHWLELVGPEDEGFKALVMKFLGVSGASPNLRTRLLTDVGWQSMQEFTIIAFGAHAFEPESTQRAVKIVAASRISQSSKSNICQRKATNLKRQSALKHSPARKYRHSRASLTPAPRPLSCVASCIGWLD